MHEHNHNYNLDPVKAFYKKHLQKYPEGDIRTMGWHDPEEYLVRFKVMTSIANLEGASVLDVGCGIGGLYKYLQEQGVHVQYLGVDILPEMIERAHKSFSQPPHSVSTTPSNPSFKTVNILTQDLPQFDYVFCIGALNISSEGFDSFFRAMTRKMITLARKGVGLNFLCNKEKLAAGPYHFENPEKLKEELEREYGVRVVVDNEQSLDGECCLFIYKE